MAERIVIPREGQGMESAVITEWFVEVGDKVSFGDGLCEAESEKASFPIEAAVSGTVLALCYEAGETAPVLETIAVIGNPGEEFDHLLPGAPQSETMEAKAEAVAKERSPESRHEQRVEPSSDKRRISPRAKRLAQARGVDISAIAADPIRERDVVTYLEAGEAAGTQFVALTNRRRIIAEKMFTSVQSSAQFTVHSFADVTKVLQYHQKIKESSSVTTRITLNDLFLFITVRTLDEFGELNAHFDSNRYAVFEDVHLGVAVDTPSGLIVPVIKDARSLRLVELAQACAVVVGNSRNGNLKPSDLEGGTFTVSNLGPMGVEHFTPILNYPEVAILGVGGIYPRPFRTDNGIEHIDCVCLSLIINHQAVDGATGARFLQTFAKNAGDIDLLLAI